MKKTLYFTLIIAVAISALLVLNSQKTVDENASTTALNVSETPNDGIVHLSSKTFKEQIFDYSASKTWKYKGTKPAIVDFYADWCRPCKMLSPTLVELQKEYGGKIQIYKINTDNNPDISQAFGISGIPALLFIPKTGEPQMATGLLPKETLESNIQTILGVKK